MKKELNGEKESVRHVKKGNYGGLTSTKLDWYFWSRGATNRCTSPRSLTYTANTTAIHQPSHSFTLTISEPRNTPSHHLHTARTTSTIASFLACSAKREPSALRSYHIEE